jgi:hypothetical protein
MCIRVPDTTAVFKFWPHLVLDMPEILLQGLIFVYFFLSIREILFPFEVILSMWVFHLRLDCSVYVTPRYFAEVTGSRM